jgi:hypothetical protein
MVFAASQIHLRKFNFEFSKPTIFIQLVRGLISIPSTLSLLMPFEDILAHSY